MRAILTATVLSVGLAISTPALAGNSSKFESSVTAPLQQAVKLEIVLSEKMAYRANHLPKDLSDRGHVRTLQAGFAGNGHYGERELERLTERFEKKLERRLTKEGVRVDPQANAVLRVTIEDAKPNRPTFGQLSKQPSLSYHSIGIGGAELSAQLISAGGESFGDMSYSWYETDIRDSAYGGTWSDAHRAFDRFSRKAAKTLAN